MFYCAIRNEWQICCIKSKNTQLPKKIPWENSDFSELKKKYQYDAQFEILLVLRNIYLISVDFGHINECLLNSSTAKITFFYKEY